MNEPKLVTLAIHTYEKAQILKTLLESEGVGTFLHNINQIQPVISAGVRVRINEVDLPKALRIIEDNQWDRDETDEKKKDKAKKDEPTDYVLIPVDFSDYTMKICELGFHFAARRGLSVVLMHVHLSPFYTAPLTIGDTHSFQIVPDLNLRKEMQRVTRQMNELKKVLRSRISKEELPELAFTSVIRDGAPEEVILSYSRKYPPVMIVMGTRGKSRKDSDLIGSVAAEVIDSARVPVLVIPEEVPFTDFRKAKHVAVATSFDQRDLVLFDAFMALFGNTVKPTMHVFNISTSTPEWNEVQLKAVREYYKTHYPDAIIQYNVLDQGDFSLALEKFIRAESVDVIVVNTYKRNLFAKFFNPSMARRMLFHAGTPLLVMHGQREIR